MFVADHLLFGSLLVLVSYTHCLYSTKIQIYVAILSNIGYSPTGQMVQLEQFNWTYGSTGQMVQLDSLNVRYKS